MYNKIWGFIPFYFLLLGNTNAQITGNTGPGGVGGADGTSELVAWYYPSNMRDATNVLPSDGETVNTWLDGSGYGNTLTNTGTATYEDDGSSLINGNAVLSASALDQEFSTSGSITGKTIIVVNDPGSQNDDEGLVGFGNNKGITRPGATDNVWAYSSDSDADAWTNTTGTSSINGSTTDGGTHSNNLHIVNQERPATHTDTFYVGGYESGETFTGTIAEVIVYDDDLNLAQKIILENYLEAKYDINLSENDEYLMDNSAKGDFDYHVAGIGQATDGSNHTDAQGEGIVRIHSPDDLQNGEYLFWGRENLDAMSFSTSAQYTERLNAKWRVGRRGNPGKVTVVFDLSGVDLSGMPACGELHLVRDNDSDFSSPLPGAVLTNTSGSLYEATNVQLANNNYITLEYFTDIVLDGTGFYNGSVSSTNGPNVNDDCYNFLIKSTADGSITIDRDIDVASIEVEAGGVLVINSGESVELVTGGIDNDGEIRMLGTSQLLQNHTGASMNTGTGSFFIQQQDSLKSTNSMYRYNYWSSPVHSVGSSTYTVADVLKDGTTELAAATSHADVVFTAGYDGSTGPLTISDRWIYKLESSTGWEQIGSSGTLNSGQGYTMKGSGASVQNYVFEGVANDGDIHIAVTSGDHVLVGNPYPSALDASDFLDLNNTTNGIIDGSLYFWEHNGEVSTSGNEGHYIAGYQGGYGVRNIGSGVAPVAPAGIDGLGTSSGDRPKDKIPIAQGFIVEATGTGNVTFTNAMRTFQLEGNQSIFFKGGKSSREVVEEEEDSEYPSYRLGFLQTNAQGQLLQREVVTVFKEGLTDGFNSGYDSKSIDVQDNELYLQVEDSEEKYVITGVDSYNASKEIPLGVQIGVSGTVSFGTLEKIGISEEAYLYDGLEGVSYPLSEGNTVSLELEEGVYDDRFSIRFEEGATLSEKPYDVSSLVTLRPDRVSEVLEVVVSDSSVEVLSIELYDLLGGLQKSVTSTNRISTAGLAPSVYIVKIKTTAGTTVSKLFL